MARAGRTRGPAPRASSRSGLRLPPPSKSRPVARFTPGGMALSRVPSQVPLGGFTTAGERPLDPGDLSHPIEMTRAARPDFSGPRASFAPGPPALPLVSFVGFPFSPPPTPNELTPVVSPHVAREGGTRTGTPAFSGGDGESSRMSGEVQGLAPYQRQRNGCRPPACRIVRDPDPAATRIPRRRAAGGLDSPGSE